MTRQEYNKAVDQHADGLFRFLVKNINDKEAAEDVLQDVFTKLWEKKGDVRYDKVKSYIFTSGYHTMIDYFRKSKKSTDFEYVSESEYSHDRQYSDLNEILQDAVKRLPEIQRSAVMLRDYEGYTYQEIGEILGLNESQVKVYIFRARKSLQQYIKSVETVL